MSSFYWDLKGRIQKQKEKIKEGKNVLPWTFYFKLSFECFVLGVAVNLIKFYYLLFKSSFESFTSLTRIPALGINPNNYSLYSFKKYQKKTRIFSVSTTIAAVLILSLSFSLLFPGITFGATFTWEQTSWNTADTNPPFPLHPTNQTGWDKYYEKEPNIDTETAGEIKLLSQDNHAYEKGGAVPTSPTDYASEATSADYTAISSSDDSRWVTALAANDEYDSQIFTFNITEDGGSISNLNITWEGYGETGAGLDTDLSIYNWNTTSWEQKDTNDFTSAVDDNLTSAISSSISNYVHSTTKQVAILVSTEKPRTLGQSCSLTSQCASGFCADGVCCDSACSGSTCQRCDSYSVNGAGHCGYVSSLSEDPDNECTQSCTYTGDCSGSGYSCGTGVGADTAWGEGIGACNGSNQRCYGGECIICGGWMNAGYCWYEGAFNQNCNTVCSSRGGVYQGTCDWINDPEDCSTCKHWHSLAGCNAAYSIIGPEYWSAINSCYRHRDGESDCEGTHGSNYKRQCACNKCPFFYSWNSSEYVFDNYIIHELDSKDKETIQERNLNNLSLKGKIKAKITEEMNETAFIDQLYLKISKENKTVKLKPISASRNFGLIQKSDDYYLVMNYGDEIEIEFESVPEFFKDAEGIKIIAEGYYIKNHKSQITNSKQIQNPKFQIPNKNFNKHNSLYTDYVKIEVGSKIYAWGISSTLTSFPYNTSDTGNVLAKIEWSETLPADTDIQFQVRTGADSTAILSNTWMGPDGTSGTYFTDPAGGEAIPIALKDGADDQWIQYKTFLSSTGASTPTLSDVTMTYVVNAPPAFDATYENSGVLALQDTDTKVDISYKIGDVDSATGTNTPNFITPSFEYSTDGGSNWSDVEAAHITWGSAPTGGEITDTNSDGDLDNRVLGDPNSNEVLDADEYLIYMLEWDAKAQLNPDIYVNNNFQIRVTLNDNEAANYSAIQASASFTLDTIDPFAGTPTGGGTGININQNQLTSKGNDKTDSVSVTLNLSCSDDTALEMILSNDGVFDTEVYESYSATKAWDLTSGDGTKTVYVKFKDAYGNEVGSYTDTIDLDESPPAIPFSMYIQDVSNSETGEYRMFINWAKNTEADWVDYEIYKSENGTDYSLLETITDINLNYKMDIGLTEGQIYYYKLTATDDISNTSPDSEVVSLTAGGNPSDIVPPNISDVQAGTPTASSVTITWITDESATSDILYSKDPDTSCNLTQGVDGYDTSHSVTLIGLDADSTYNFKAKSCDASNNCAESTIAQFITSAGDTSAPVITLGPASSDITYSAAAITWTTDENSDSFVEYSIISPVLGDTMFGKKESVTAHSITLQNLNSSATYYYKVHSEDAAGNEVVSSEFSFDTLAAPDDITPPVISNIQSSDILYNTATITWDTDENSSSFVEFGLDTSYGRIYGDGDSTISHSVNLPKDLTPSTLYHYRVRSVDASGNEAISGDGVFTTAASPDDTTAPVISNVQIGEPTATGVVITWITNEDSDSYIEYSEDQSYNLSQGVPTMAASHSVTLVGLSPSTQYYFQVKSTDPSGNTRTDNNSGAGWTFATASGALPPEISDILIVDVEYNTATIIWTTDINSDSFVEYGLDTSYGKSTGQYDSVVSHTVNLENLLSEATYHFRVRSEAGGSEAVSSDLTLTTGAAPDATPPVISNVAAIGIASISATITWDTDENSDSIVDYGETAAYSFVAGDTANSTISHSVSLTNLSQGTDYYFQVKSKDSFGNLATDDNGGASYQFTTVSDTAAPVISNLSALAVDRNSATITWDTDELAASQVEYSLNSDLSDSSLTDIVSDLRTEHSVIITGLTSETVYYYRARSEDAPGNEAILPLEEPYNSFTTAAAGEDEAAPVIFSVEVSGITASGAAITWITDEDSNSIVDYGETVSLGLLAGNITEADVNHSLTLTNLSPNTLYYFQVRSQDASGNLATDDNDGEYYSFETLDLETDLPVISDVSVSENMDWAVIIWSTDLVSTSQAEYGLDINYGNESDFDNILTRKHAIKLTSLTPSTTYHFKVKSKNSEGEESASGDQTFTTQEETICEDCTEEEAKNVFEQLPEEIFTKEVFEIASKTVSAPKILGGEPKVETTSTTARITWLTDKAANSIVAIAKGDEYDSTKKEPYAQRVGNSEEQVLSHSVNIAGLQPRTLYHFQLRSKPLIGPTGKSKDYTFKTKSFLPQISNIEFVKTEDYSITLSWTTNISCDTIVEYTDKKTKETKTQGEPVFERDHLFTLENLEFNRDYSLIIKARDNEGNETKSEILSFSTKKDEDPPIISQVKADSTLFPGREEKVQTIISWKTDEMSTAQLFYQEGLAGGAELKSSQKDSALTKEHFVVITKFKPSTVYKFYVESEDLAGNKSKSKDFTTLTPKRKESVIQLIIRNFESIFGWTKQLKF